VKGRYDLVDRDVHWRIILKWIVKRRYCIYGFHSRDSVKYFDGRPFEHLKKIVVSKKGGNLDPNFNCWFLGYIKRPFELQRLLTVSVDNSYSDSSVNTEQSGQELLAGGLDMHGRAGLRFAFTCWEKWQVTAVVVCNPVEIRTERFRLQVYKVLWNCGQHSCFFFGRS